MIYSKFDVAERQLLQAILLFFNNGDPISIHTLTEAAGQVLSDIGEQHGAVSFIRTNDMVRPEKQKEWLKNMFKSRNFFKHANNDQNETHEFKSELNDFSLLDAVNMYHSIKKSWVPETIAFQVWFSANYPHLLKSDSEFNKKIIEGASYGYPMDKNTLFQMIEMLRAEDKKDTNIVLKYGL